MWMWMQFEPEGEKRSARHGMIDPSIATEPGKAVRRLGPAASCGSAAVTAEAEAESSSVVCRRVRVGRAKLAVRQRKQRAAGPTTADSLSPLLPMGVHFILLLPSRLVDRFIPTI